MLSAGLHIGGLALPIIALLHKPAGQAISYIATSLKMLSTGNELRIAKKWSSAHAWSILKNGTEFIGTVASLRIGLAIHAIMNLGENLYILPHSRRVGAPFDKAIFPIFSNALYLLTLVSFSNPYGFICASLIFQAFVSFKKAYTNYNEAKTWKEMKILDAAAHGAMMLIYLAKIPTAFIISQISSPRTFVLMRPASKHDKESPEGGLTQKGRLLAETKIPAALRKIMLQNGYTSVTFFPSSAAHHKQTAKIVDDKFGWDGGIDDSMSSELDETKKPILTLENQKEAHIRWKNLPTEKRWVTSPAPEQGIESSAQVANRMDGAIREILDIEDDDLDELPVIITGGTNIKRYLEGEILKNPEIPASAARNIKDGGMRVVTMMLGDSGNLEVTTVEAVDPKKA
ncbi:MAG TPA: hypothetical protein VHK67_05210 [Rhabdochlamydiaceae bacterium]|nr:hypothetical protein [Rhabdochlamydiaceae bacterium]